VRGVSRYVLARDRRSELHDVATEPTRRRRAHPGDVVDGPRGGADHEIPSFEDRHAARVRSEQHGRLVDDFLEHRDGVELGRKRASGARELLRQGSRDPLRLERAAALERGARRLGDTPAELEVVARERAPVGEEHDDQSTAVALDRDGEQCFERRVAPEAVEALVVASVRRGHDAAVGGCLHERRRELELPQPVREPVRARDSQAAAGFGHHHRCERAVDRLGRGVRRSVQRLRARERLGEQRRDARGHPVDACLACPLGEGLRVPECERGETRERLEEIEVVLLEAPLRSGAHADAENAPHVAAPNHRRHERLDEAEVRIVRHLMLEPFVVM